MNEIRVGGHDFFLSHLFPFAFNLLPQDHPSGYFLKMLLIFI